MSSALEVLSTLLERVMQTIPANRLVLLGFSQGACLTLEFAARNARGKRPRGMKQILKDGAQILGFFAARNARGKRPRGMQQVLELKRIKRMTFGSRAKRARRAASQRNWSVRTN